MFCATTELDDFIVVFMAISMSNFTQRTYVDLYTVNGYIYTF